MRCVRKDCAAPPFVLLGDVHGDRGPDVGVRSGVEYFEWPERFTLERIVLQARDETAFVSQPRRRVVVGMATFPIGQDHGVRLEFANHASDCGLELVAHLEVRVRQAEIASPR